MREASTLRPTFIALVLLALAPPVVALGGVGAADGPTSHDHEGTIIAGHGRLGLVHGYHYFVFDSPTSAIGFDHTGDIRYHVEPISFGNGFIHRVTVMGPVGSYALHFTLDWVTNGPADVPFAKPVAFQDNCRDALCIQ